MDARDVRKLNKKYVKENQYSSQTQIDNRYSIIEKLINQLI